MNIEEGPRNLHPLKKNTFLIVNPSRPVHLRNLY